MTSEQAAVLRVSRGFNFTPEQVFDAWLDPRLAARFLFATPDGEMVRVEIDPRVGGAFTIVERRNGEDVLHEGEYLEIERPRRLVFTLRVPKYSPDTNRVTIEIEPAPAGCELSLTSEMRPVPPERHRQVREGWKEILDGLAATLGEAATPLR